MQAIAERVPAHVMGDGRNTVASLVEITNADPRRGVGHEKVLTRIKVDAAAAALVRDQGFEMDDVPPEGQMVKLALTGNMSTGGISVDRTFDAHPDNIEIAEEAARMIGLDVAGIDFICPDIASPVRETGGAICEVNAAPGFRMHTHLTVGEPQYIAKPVVDLLFPLVAGADRRRHRHQRQDHHRAHDRPHLQGHRPQGRHDLDRRDRHRRAARHQVGRVRASLGPHGPAEPPCRLRRHGGRPRRHPARGLGYDRNDVAVVTNIAPDHLGMRGIDTLEQLADVKAVVVEAVPRDGFAVLNADDDHVRRMRRRCSGGIVWFCCSRPAPRSASSSRTTADAVAGPSCSSTPTRAT